MQSMKKEFLETRNSVNTMEASVSTMDHSINELKSLSLGLRTSGQRYVVANKGNFTYSQNHSAKPE